MKIQLIYTHFPSKLQLKSQFEEVSKEQLRRIKSSCESATRGEIQCLELVVEKSTHYLGREALAQGFITVNTRD